MSYSTFVAIFALAAAAAAAPVIPVAVAGSSSSNVNSGAFDNGSVANVSPFGSNVNSWNNGFNAHQDAAANPWGNAGRSSFNNWNNNAWSNNIYPYPAPYW
ncbi:hypothetical protein GGI25_003102 [Coemansia spiralis]|uniref:Secreted protein n=2 Tax=Coemansia TaxID=4863 RepID=A0A9W8G6R7_9FUNG|nr:hypothetical protein BX070DRAFT_229177 [Coemansia spiralis]KAJ1994549.1 hypothetical protein EDC05_001465 [Coemansia umbellata]KAJ2624355.1 hypothetical protein GGI26_001489 [Coemansia sp. RSA 1358]KAJ2677582.1 hypothetical protein GGI25_003102 [Coemansia spiralis]